MQYTKVIKILNTRGGGGYTTVLKGEKLKKNVNFLFGKELNVTYVYFVSDTWPLHAFMRYREGKEEIISLKICCHCLVKRRLCFNF